MSHTSKARTSIILVAGSWHNSTHTSAATEALQQAGYRVVPCHPFARPRTSYDDDTEFIRSAIRSEIDQNQKICVILHSQAGRQGIEAVNRILAESDIAKPSFRKIIWLASFLTTDAADIPSLLNGDVTFNLEEGYASAKANGAKLFYNDTSPEEAQRLADALEEKMELFPPNELSSEAFKSVENVYVKCLRDQIVTIELQERTAKEVGARIVEVNGGHCVFSTQPEVFAEVVERILER